MRDHVRSAPGAWRRNGKWAFKIQRAQQAGNAVRLGMEEFEFGERQTMVLKRRSRMHFRLPLDQCRGDTVQRKGAVGGDGDEPIKRAATHRLNVSKCLRTSGRSRANIGSARHPGRKHGGRGWGQRVESEPARPRWRGSLGVRGYDFEEQRVAKPKKKVVRSHAGMLSARLRRDAKCLTYKLRTGFERRCGDGDVVDEAAWHFKVSKV